ncbi:MAG: nucleoside monophosphate kinase [Candidatus Nomurabacteria bacterium]|nr:nucleoside monophosphate kinase [Candidatus Nomurabacteria bacterium]
MNKTKTLIFVGRSGSGKGTQIELLKNLFASKYEGTEIKLIAMGDIFRAFFKESGYVQDIARDISMKQGKFQPDFITDALFVRNTINILDENSILFFDGYPRNINQLEIMRELLNYVNRGKPIVLNIEVSRESVKTRMLSRGRGDDNDSAINSRLDEYDKYILPMLEVLKTDSSFDYIEIKGEGKIEEIHADIINKINPYLS